MAPRSVVACPMFDPRCVTGRRMGARSIPVTGHFATEIPDRGSGSRTGAGRYPGVTRSKIRYRENQGVRKKKPRKS